MYCVITIQYDVLCYNNTQVEETFVQPQQMSAVVSSIWFFCSLKMYVLKNLYLIDLLTYILTPRSRSLLEKVTGSHIVKKFLAFSKPGSS
jgi:hypothetical protein